MRSEAGVFSLPEPAVHIPCSIGCIWGFVNSHTYSASGVGYTFCTSHQLHHLGQKCIWPCLWHKLDKLVAPSLTWRWRMPAFGRPSQSYLIRSRDLICLSVASVRRCCDAADDTLETATNSHTDRESGLERSRCGGGTSRLTVAGRTGAENETLSAHLHDAIFKRANKITLVQRRNFHKLRISLQFLSSQIKVFSLFRGLSLMRKAR